MSDLSLRINQIIQTLDKEDVLLKGVITRFFNQDTLDIAWLEHGLKTPEIINNADSWVDMRLLRNKLVHEYVDDTAELFEHLLLAKKFSTDLSQGFINLKSILQKS